MATPIQELVEASMGKAMGAKARLTPEGYLHPEETFALVEAHRAYMREHGYRLRQGWAFRARLVEPATLALVAVDPEDRERDAADAWELDLPPWLVAWRCPLCGACAAEADWGTRYEYRRQGRYDPQPGRAIGEPLVTEEAPTITCTAGHRCEGVPVPPAP
jgi:hypothetical protein